LRAENTPEYESYKDDAIAVLNGVAFTIALMGVWTKPLYTGPIALLLAVFGYFLSPRGKGGMIIAVIVTTIAALLIRWQWGYSLN
jgi:hypothetical protein